MGAAVATQRTLDLNAVSKELRGLGAATRKRVLDAVRAGELRPHMLLNTTPKDLARLGFAGDALQDVQVALASVRQGETDRLAAIEAHKERERFEAGRAAREAEEAARREAEAAAAALAKRNDAWRSQRATVDAFEQLVRTQRHVLAAHPASIFQVAVAQADPLQAAPGAAGSMSGAGHLFRSTRHSEALAEFAHLRPCLGGGSQWAKRVRRRRTRGGALADELSSSSSSSSSSDGCRAPLRLAWPVRCVAVAAEPGVGCIVSGGGSDPAALALGIEAAAAELAVWDARKGELVHLLPKPPQPVGTLGRPARTQRAGAATGSAGGSSSGGGGGGGGTRGGIAVSAPAVQTSSVLGEAPRAALRVANSASSEAAAAAAAEAVEEERPPAHTGPVRCVAITPDASFCVSGGEDGNVLVWRVSTGQCVCRMGAEANSGGKGAHAAPVESVALSADGRSVVSAAFTPPRAVAATGASLLGGSFGIGIGGGSPLRHGHPDPPSPPSPRLGTDADASATADAAAAGRVPLSSTVEVCVWEVVEHTPEDVAPGSPGASFVHWPLPRGAAKGPCLSRMLVPAGAHLRGVAAGGAAAGARVAMSRSGAWLVVGTARVLNLYDGEGQVSGLAWGGGGSAAASDDDAAAAAAAAEAATGAAALPSSHFCSLDMSPDADGRFVVTGHGGGAGSGGADAGSGLGSVGAGGGFVQLWDRASWSRLRVFAHSAPVHSVSFSSLASADERAAAEQGSSSSSSSSADLEGEGLGHLRVCSASHREVCVWHACTGRNVAWHQLQVGSGRAKATATATTAASPSESTSPADRAASPTASVDDVDVDDVDDWRVEEMTIGSPPPALGMEDGTAPAAGGAASSDSEGGSEGDDTWSAHGGGQSFMAGETGDDTFGSAACALSPEASEASPRQLVDGGEDGGAAAVGGTEGGDEVAGERISCIAACGGGMVVLGTQLLSSNGISALAAETTGPEVRVATRGRIFMHMLTEPPCE
jgi:hypothetical protein